MEVSLTTKAVILGIRDQHLTKFLAYGADPPDTLYGFEDEV
jgi:hypothetical protein